MMNYEKEIEDYICNHQEGFIETLKYIYGESADINFIGRQVNIGTENIADLIYFFEDTDLDKKDNVYKTKNYIVVELKNRELLPKDLSQLSRYVQTLQLKLEKEDNDKLKHFVYGVFVVPDISYEMKHILMNNKNGFEYILFAPKLEYLAFDRNFEYSDEYIENIELDERLKI